MFPGKPPVGSSIVASAVAPPPPTGGAAPPVGQPLMPPGTWTPMTRPAGASVASVSPPLPPMGPPMLPGPSLGDVPPAMGRPALPGQPPVAPPPGSYSASPWGPGLAAAAPYPSAPPVGPMALQYGAAPTPATSMVGTAGVASLVPQLSAASLSDGALPRPDSLWKHDDFQLRKQPLTLSCTVAPMSASMLTSYQVPLGAIVTPLAPGDKPTPVINFGPGGVIRCRRCRAYVNPYVAFTDGGRRWSCNVCRFANDVPPEYFSPLDTNTGLRLDLQQRPELCETSCEFVAPAEYMVRPPQPPCYLFLLDVSSGCPFTALKGICDTIRSVVLEDGMPGAERTLFGILCYDTAVHLFRFVSPEKYHLITMPELDDDAPLLPVPDAAGHGLLVPLREFKEAIVEVLEKIPVMFGKSNASHACLGNAVLVGMRIMGPVGGKMVLSVSSLPSAGQKGTLLASREDFKQYGSGSDKERAMYDASEKFYKDTAAEMSRLQIACDILLTAPFDRYVDLANVGVLAKYTAGMVFHLRGALLDSLRRLLMHNLAWEAVMRIRISQGLKVGEYFGPYFMRGADLLALPNVSPEHSYGVTLVHSGPPSSVLPTPHVYLQVALLYTSSSGERRIRAHNAALPVTSNLSDLYSSSNELAISSLLARIACQEMLQKKASAVRLAIQDKVVTTLRAYRSTTASAASLMSHSTELVLPERMKLLPLLALCLLKHSAFRADDSVRADERVYSMMQLLQREDIASAMPQCVDVRSLDKPVPLTQAHMDSDGVYALLYDQDQLLFLVGAQSALAAASATGGGAGVPSSGLVPSILENPRLRAFCHQQWGVRPENALLLVDSSSMLVREGDGRMQMRWQRYMVEDRNAAAMSYAEFLVFIHSGR